MASDISSQFTGLPIEDLIVSPIVGMAKGQANSCSFFGRGNEQSNDRWRYR